MLAGTLFVLFVSTARCPLPGSSSVNKADNYQTSAAVSKIFRLPTASFDCAPFSEALSFPAAKKIRRPQQRGCVPGTNGRAGSGRQRAEGMGIGVLLQGWPCRATTPPNVASFRTGCRCVEQLGRVKAKKKAVV